MLATMAVCSVCWWVVYVLHYVRGPHLEEAQELPPQRRGVAGQRGDVSEHVVLEGVGRVVLAGRGGGTALHTVLLHMPGRQGNKGGEAEGHGKSEGVR